MSSFDWKKCTEDFVKDKLIITAISHWNLLCANSSKHKATKSISRCYERCLWHMCWGVSKQLCSLQEMNQQVNDLVGHRVPQQYHLPSR